ncbi:hypothetical protein TNCV_4115361 [Trichonephila clavipes]|nr:hypothetical protein TNCV_4115361 [Trichonephila clavipes]
MTSIDGACNCIPVTSDRSEGVQDTMSRPHEAKNCNRAFEDPLICANCGGEHVANWRQCPRFPKTKNNKKAPQKGNQNKNQYPKIANEEGVDEELLARAFRAELPALRKLSHPDDNACEIFQAYVALKNGCNFVAHNSA